MLDSDLLEKKLVLTAGGSRALPEIGLPDLTVSASLEIGYIWNVLKLIDVAPELIVGDINEIQYWSPSNEDLPVFSVFNRSKIQVLKGREIMKKTGICSSFYSITPSYMGAKRPVQLSL